ncbi:hypothetical protein F2P81_008433 [Scophthalmus maximus]|uniref:Uncharacterized protein n=1 Tax=Scophthalmus maximus TaxID=52904 RepID=A0A6A4T794_SCOMX|nr:hypothetical protein F2P81_008433 [Scophthalmus maximus]
MSHADGRTRNPSQKGACLLVSRHFDHEDPLKMHESTVTIGSIPSDSSQLNTFFSSSSLTVRCGTEWKFTSEIITHRHIEYEHKRSAYDRATCWKSEAGSSGHVTPDVCVRVWDISSFF